VTGSLPATTQADIRRCSHPLKQLSTTSHSAFGNYGVHDFATSHLILRSSSQILRQIWAGGRKQGPKECARVPAAVHSHVQQLQVKHALIFLIYLFLNRMIGILTFCSRRFSLRYMECADVDMSLCVSQFSGAPLDDALPPSSLPTNPTQPSSPAWKGEAGSQNFF
jgi:hypothetical protein